MILLKLVSCLAKALVLVATAIHIELVECSTEAVAYSVRPRYSVERHCTVVVDLGVTCDCVVGVRHSLRLWCTVRNCCCRRLWYSMWVESSFV